MSYDHLFAGKHQVTVLLGQSAQEFNYSNLQGGRSGYVNDFLQELNNGPVNAALGNSGTSSQNRLASYFGRVNYEFGGKYLFSATLRRDGSSAFAPGRKFGVFPGVSAGWRISEEEFLRGSTTVSNLKIRAGYGKVGNPLNAGQFAYLATINSQMSRSCGFGPFGPELSNG